MPDLPPTCAFCFKPLERIRITKKFCDDSCRNNYNLLPERIEKLVAGALTNLQTVEDLLSMYPHLAETARTPLETITNAAKRARPRKPYTRKTP